MNIWHDFAPSRITTKSFEAYIEIPNGSKAKYELDKETGILRLDRVLYTSTVYPANYGFIPRTYADDGDPPGVLVLCNETIYPATLVRCYPIGVIKMIDGGSLDEKIIAIPFDDPTYNNYYDIQELPQHIFQEMMHFFEVYNVITLTSEVNTLALGCNQTGVTWSSSDTSVATVSGGVVTLHSAGSTTITATKGDKTDSFVLVVVRGQNASSETVTVEGFPQSGEVSFASRTLQLSATCSDESEIEWISENKSVATVDQTGKVTFLNLGSVDIVNRATEKSLMRLRKRGRGS